MALQQVVIECRGILGADDRSAQRPCGAAPMLTHSLRQLKRCPEVTASCFHVVRRAAWIWASGPVHVFYRTKHRSAQSLAACGGKKSSTET